MLKAGAVPLRARRQWGDSVEAEKREGCPLSLHRHVAGGMWRGLGMWRYVAWGCKEGRLPASPRGSAQQPATPAAVQALQPSWQQRRAGMATSLREEGVYCAVDERGFVHLHAHGRGMVSVVG